MGSTKRPTKRGLPDERRGVSDMKQLTRILLLIVAWVSFALGCLGIFVPVLPTTPFLLLAGFLFARSSPRTHAWLCRTGVYRRYVSAFKQAGGIPLTTKIRIIDISYAVMGISALLVQRPFVWAILGCVALFLLYLMTIRIPTIDQRNVDQVRSEDTA